ncbi:MobF family relaxase [Paraburkholderia nemoris]|uniref:MobF family relaxase n=1 Tax=Paraburkholderia nemoris TaxID=2793076 RepID=UPI0038B9264A
MLTLAKVSSSDAAAGYYEAADDYYGEEGCAPSAWWGVGAEHLDLVGRVMSSEFRALLDGKLPDGGELQGGAEGRRAGTDLTFSAPKSVSLQALVGGDVRLVGAHERAVSSALSYVEKHMATYRLTVDGETHRLPSGNLLAARFQHDLSRNCDPQLHTHCVVINATRNALGDWRALDVTELYRQQKLVGAFYRAELAQEVRRLGYGVRLTHADGRFELAHIGEHQVQAFSTRSQSIVNELQKRGKDRNSATAREKELAGLSTRKRKDGADRATLREDWQAASVALGINYSPPQATALTHEDKVLAIRDATSFAIEHATERQSVVTFAELASTALGHVTGAGGLSDIEADLARRVNGGELRQAGERYTTDAALAREREILAAECRGREAVREIAQPSDIRSGLTKSGLNGGQRAAAELILTSRNRFVGIQGLAGTGKTHMLTEVKSDAGRHGWRVMGVAPSAAAATELGKSGIPSVTIAAFLQRQSKGLNERVLLVVDEAGMVPAVDMLGIVKATEQAGARAVLVGDTQQLKAVQAGKPFAQLQRAGMQTAMMSDILRQSSITLKRAVEHAAASDIKGSLKLLESSLIEIDHAEARHARIAHDYAVLAPSERANSLIVAGTNAARLAINAEVRQRLGLKGIGISVKVLERRDLTQAQLRSSISYQAGDVVELQTHYDSLGLQRGMAATVLEAGAGRVTLQREDGQSVEWRPALMSKVAVYRIAEREFAVGDDLRFTANNYGLGYLNGDRGKVLAIDPEGANLLVQKRGGETISLDTTAPVAADHGYCTTIHSGQGQTCWRVFIDADVRAAVANESLFYVAISRAREEVRIYTDDRALLPSVMSRSDEKTAALDLVQP